MRSTAWGRMTCCITWPLCHAQGRGIPLTGLRPDFTPSRNISEGAVGLDIEALDEGLLCRWGSPLSP